MAKSDELMVVDQIDPMILLIREHRVVLDADLARLFGVSTKRLNEQIKRNRDRFPIDFVFTLTSDERNEVVANCDHLRKLKYSKSLPLAFTEHGAIMAANVLNSRRAIEMSVYIVRAFIKLREVLLSHKELAHKLAELDRKVESHDESIRSLVAAIRQLTAPPPEPGPRRRIGFRMGGLER